MSNARQRTASITYAIDDAGGSAYTSVPLLEHKSIDEKEFQNRYGQTVPKKNCSQRCQSWVRKTFTPQARRWLVGCAVQCSLVDVWACARPGAALSPYCAVHCMLVSVWLRIACVRA